jgi:hypothetical protein
VTRFNHRNENRAMLYRILQRDRIFRRPVTCERTSRTFEAGYDSPCLECGAAIQVGSYAHQARRASHVGIAHDRCPTPEELLAQLFKIDGDIVLRRLYDPSPQWCYICRDRQVEVEIANPSIMSPQVAAYVCDECVIPSGNPRPLEVRRAERLTR